MKYNVTICGGAGVLGSTLAEKLVASGHEVTLIDIVRREEAWRLENVMDKVDYVWKSTMDLQPLDVVCQDFVIDAGLGVADRPFGNVSAEHTTINNVLPALRVLETIRKLPEPDRPIYIYPSSFNSLYLYPQGTTYTPKLLSNPSSIYGWTKGAVEQLAMVYNYAYKTPTIVIRVGSGYGPRMRADELPAKLILTCLKDRKTFNLRSPDCKRLWSYGKDLIAFYENLLPLANKYVGKVIHDAGNTDMKTVSNRELAALVAKVCNYDLKVIDGPYEEGERINNQPIDFNFEITTDFWKPNYSLEQGVKETALWFKENEWRYV